MKRLKRAVCGGVAVLMLLVTPLNGYMQVQAAEVVVGATAWEILQTIFLSLGITMTIQDSSLVDEVCTEVVDTYNMWLNSNGWNSTAELTDDLTSLLVSGKDKVIQLSEDVWNGLKAWTKSIANNETPIISSNKIELTYNMIDTCNYTELVKRGKDGLVLVNGCVYFTNISVSRYGMIAYKMAGTETACVILYSDSPFNCVLNLYSNSSWVKYPSDYESGVSAPWSDALKSNSVKATKYSRYGNSVYYVDASLMALSDTDVSIPCFKTNELSWKNARQRVLESFFDSKGNLAIKDSANLTHDVVGGTAVESGAWDIISKGRTWEDNALHGDVTITVPDDVTGDIVRVGSGEATVSDVISTTENPAIPVDTTADTAIDYPMDISESIDYVDTKDITNDTVIDKDVPKYDDITDSETSGEYYVQGLQNVFPFCLPFDVFDFLSVLSAPAEAPHFKVPIKYPTLSGMETYEVDLDLSKFNSVAKILRTAEILLFCVGLAVATRNLYIRG